MSNALHRSLLRNPPHAVAGDGAYLIDDSGKRYLDACGGAAVSCLGHSHPEVIAAIQKQVEILPYAHTSFFTTDVLEELADTLVDGAPGMGKVMLLSGGSEAVEAALKLSRQFFLESGEPDRHLFIARRQSFHGNTLGALAVGGNEWRRESFRPLLVPGNHIAPCFEYRERIESETQDEYCERVAVELETKIIELGPGNVAAFVAETVVGATAGAVVATPGYFGHVRIIPDIVTMAKGMAAGYQPVGALLCRAEIIDTIRSNSGFFQHGHTFMGHATAVAASLATLQAIKKDKLLQNVVKRGKQIRAGLRNALANHPGVGDVRGRGLFIGVELVADRETKEPLDPALKIHNKVQQAAMNNGLLCYGMGGTIDGRRGDHILIAPPYNLTEAQQQELVEKLSAAIVSSLPC